MAVAGPDLSGSGRGVPVPSMTICVCAGCARTDFFLIFMASFHPDIGCPDDGLPLIGDALEQGARFGPGACDRLHRLRAEALLQFGGLTDAADLALEYGPNGFRNTRRREHHLIEADLEAGV